MEYSMIILKKIKKIVLILLINKIKFNIKNLINMFKIIKKYIDSFDEVKIFFK